MAKSTPPPAPPATDDDALIASAVRYSLPALLGEIERERATGAFAMEKLDQARIGRLFTAQPRPRRVKKSTPPGQ
jgi:hypothetical protein